jgi:hypothetical protein
VAQADSTDTTNLPAPEKPQESFYLPTDISPEEVFQAIGRLRREARDEIDRLIRFLDKTDSYMFRELEDAVDDGPVDTDELEIGEGDDEPSLGSHVTPSGATSYSMPVSRNGDYDCEGDEHDGAEPENEGGEAVHEDDEPSLGWTIDGYISATSERSDECEQGGNSVRPQNRTRVEKSITVEDRGYGGRKVIRNLTDGQTKALARKIDRDSGISLN